MYPIRRPGENIILSLYVLVMSSSSELQIIKVNFSITIFIFLRF
jgi:hypothetical protein